MQKTDDGERFTVLIQAMAATFRADVTPALLEGYWIGLEDMAIERVETAIRRAIRECEFMPASQKLRGLTGGGPMYYESAAHQLERIETCRYHEVGNFGVKRGPNPDGVVPWCRKCRRLARLPSRNAPPLRLQSVPEPDRRLPRERDE